MDKIFITGSTGLLGLNIIAKLKNQYHITGSTNKTNINLKLPNLKFINLNLLNDNDIFNLLKEYKPKYLIHCAAITNIDYCENNREDCFKINSSLPINLSIICNKLKIKFIFISSDQIYSGNQNIYNEDDETCPINNYGKSKVMAENFIKKELTTFLIVRCNFFGWGPSYSPSYSDRIIDSKNKLQLLQDVSFNPIYVGELVEFIFKLLESSQNGIFNISSDEIYTKYNLGLYMCDFFAINKLKIQPFLLSQIKSKATRPKSMALDNTKLKKTLKINSISILRSLNELKNFSEISLIKKIKII